VPLVRRRPDPARAKRAFDSHFELAHQHRQLDDKNRGRRSGDRKQRLCDSHCERFVCHGMLQLLN
jgi:hypothetical protein